MLVGLGNGRCTIKFLVSAEIEIRCMILWLHGLSVTPSLTKHTNNDLLNSKFKLEDWSQINS